MALTIDQYSIYWCDLSPTFGHQVSKTRPCIVLSPVEMNQVVGTVLVAPITTKLRSSPFRLMLKVKNQEADVLFDQIRAVDKREIKGLINLLDQTDISRVKQLLHELLIA